jgi:hypothetical protein
MSSSMPSSWEQVLSSHAGNLATAHQAMFGTTDPMRSAKLSPGAAHCRPWTACCAASRRSKLDTRQSILTARGWWLGRQPGSVRCPVADTPGAPVSISGSDENKMPHLCPLLRASVARPSGRLREETALNLAVPSRASRPSDFGVNANAPRGLVRAHGN